MLSALEHPKEVENYLSKELKANRIVRIRSLLEAKALGVHCSSLGVIPKKNRPKKWRLIVDLSAPEGHSMNDGISKELGSLSYMSVDAVVNGILQRGRGTMMAKMDIQHAKHSFYPFDRLLLGMQWKGSVVVDTTLPFGQRSAPLLFTAVTDTLQFIMEGMGVQWVNHYIDDFITLGGSGTVECAENVRLMHLACKEVGLPFQPAQSRSLTSRLTPTRETRMPQNRLGHIERKESLREERSTLTHTSSLSYLHGSMSRKILFTQVN